MITAQPHDKASACETATPPVPDGALVTYRGEEYYAAPCCCRACESHLWWVLEKKIPDRNGHSAMDTGCVWLYDTRHFTAGFDADYARRIGPDLFHIYDTDVTPIEGADR